LNWSNTVDEADFMIVVSGAGSVDVPTCADGSFSTDGYGDGYDIMSWDWTLNLDHPENLCGNTPLPLESGATGFAAGGFGSSEGLFNFSYNSYFLNSSDFCDLLISGKRGTADRKTKLKDRLYVFDSNYNYMQSPNLLTSERCNIRVVRGEGNDLYLINSESGVSRLDDTHTPIVPPGHTDVNSEPRYGQSATVYVGIQGTDDDPCGRPILDAAFDASGFVYVLPVVVVPAGNAPYAAAAKLQLDTNWPFYHIIKLYDEPPALPVDNQRDYRNTLREIELDSAGNVYVTNANVMNESDILWKFEPNNGAIHRLDLGNPNSPLFLRAPVGMCVSRSTNTNMLYLASSLSNDANYNASVIHGLSTTTLLPVRTITVSGMQHVTSMTEDPVTKTLWVTGFNFNSRPPSVDPDILPFYDPYIAKISSEANNVLAIRCVVDANDLAMPLSICWTGALSPQEKCGGADLSGDGVVNLKDLAKLAAYWRFTNCAAPNNCNGADLEPQEIPDGDVDLKDLDVLADYWLNNNCQ
jgi:hypothetical protein